jgi:hypothetical protein
MNNWNTSPILQTNEIAGKYTPKGDPSLRDSKPEVKHQFLAEDLQKIRRSNHSSHQQHREDAMDDDEHDDIIKGLLYPGLEDSAFDCEFFDDDYEVAQDAVRTNSNSAATIGTSSYSDIANDDHAVHRRSTVDPFASLNENNDDSYQASYYASMGRPYSDLSSQKLRR